MTLSCFVNQTTVITIKLETQTTLLTIIIEISSLFNKRLFTSFSIIKKFNKKCLIFDASIAHEHSAGVVPFEIILKYIVTKCI